MKNTITEILIKHTLEGISSRLGIRRRQSLRDLWNNVKYMNIHIGLPEGEEGEEGGQKMYLIK